eukprot:5227436-Pyramimonas_sp.AAC.1
MSYNRCNASRVVQSMWSNHGDAIHVVHSMWGQTVRSTQSNAQQGNPMQSDAQTFTPMPSNATPCKS